MRHCGVGCSRIDRAEIFIWIHLGRERCRQWERPTVDVVLGDVRPVENLSNPNEASLDVPAGDIAGAQIAPTEVNIGGDPALGAESSVALFAAAAGFFVFAGGATVLRRRMVVASPLQVRPSTVLIT